MMGQRPLTCTECGRRTTNIVEAVVGQGPGDGDWRRFCGHCVEGLYADREALKKAAEENARCDFCGGETAHMLCNGCVS